MVTLIPRRTRSVRPAGLLRSRLTLTDLLAESVGGILQRPGRSVLTMLGTVLGIGSFVTILGLTATTAGQISSRFNLLDATQVTVTDVATRDGTSAGYSF
ncbi:MAG: ABC transporter permease, partial [Jatrophihabitantaceae bacterium]